MKRITLCCTSGVTSSMLVEKMKAVAAARGLDVEVEGCPLSGAVDRLRETDVLLLGPMIGYAKGDFDETAANYGVGVEVITADDYARMNASGILDAALARMEQSATA